MYIYIHIVCADGDDDVDDDDDDDDDRTQSPLDRGWQLRVRRAANQSRRKGFGFELKAVQGFRV